MSTLLIQLKNIILGGGLLFNLIDALFSLIKQRNRTFFHLWHKVMPAVHLSAVLWSHETPLFVGHHMDAVIVTH